MGRRLVAGVVDVITCLLIALALSAWFIFWIQSELLRVMVGGPETSNQWPVFLLIRALTIPDSDPWRVIFLLQILGVILLVGTILYEVPLTTVQGQTVGKAIAKIVVIRREDGGTPGWRAATVRAAVRSLPLLIPFVGLGVSLLVGVSPLLCRTRRGWHDKLAGTIVVAVREGS